jgi:hypothetical protein
MILDWPRPARPVPRSLPFARSGFSISAGERRLRPLLTVAFGRCQGVGVDRSALFFKDHLTMSIQPTPQPGTRPTQSEPTTHMFTVGQAVRLKGGYGIPSSRIDEIYRVIGTLPPTGNSLQYRLRHERQHYERVATENSLEMVRVEEPTEANALRDRTFAR